MLKELLKLNLQHFSEEETDTPPSDEMKNTGNEGVDDKKEHMIPKSRFDEVNNKFKDMQTQLNTLLNEKQEAEQKQKEESGQFQELYQTQKTEFDTVKQSVTQLETRNQELEAVVGNLLESKLKDVPETLHKLIPSNYSVVEKLNWLIEAESTGVFGTKVNTPIGEQTNGNANQQLTMTKDEFMALSYVERNKIYQTNAELYKKLMD